MGWLENGLDFHVPKDEEGVEGKSVVLVSNAPLESALTSSTKALGMRVVSHARILGIDAYGTVTARQRRTQYGRLTKIKKRMPKVQLQEVRCDHEQDRQSGAHAVRCTGMPLARQARGTIAHLAACYASVRSDTPMQHRANCSVGRGSVGRAAGRYRFAQGLETTAAIGGPESVVEQGQWSDRRHHHVPDAAGMDMATPRDFRHCKWARGGLTADLFHGRESTGASGQRTFAVQRMDRERRELLPCPLLGLVILASKRAQRRPQEALAIKAAYGCDTSGMVDARSGEQGGNR